MFEKLANIAENYEINLKCLKSFEERINRGKTKYTNLTLIPDKISSYEELVRAFTKHKAKHKLILLFDKQVNNLSLLTLKKSKYGLPDLICKLIINKHTFMGYINRNLFTITSPHKVINKGNTYYILSE